MARRRDPDAALLKQTLQYQKRPARGAKGKALSGPQAIGDVVADLLSRRGYAHVQTAADFGTAWKQAAGKLAAHSRPGLVRGGVLEVVVRNSLVVQELRFKKKELVAKLGEQLPDANICDFKFRVGILD